MSTTMPPVPGAPTVRGADLAHAVGNHEEEFGVYDRMRWILRCVENFLKKTYRLIFYAQGHRPIREEGSDPHPTGTAPPKPRVRLP